MPTLALRAALWLALLLWGVHHIVVALPCVGSRPPEYRRPSYRKLNKRVRGMVRMGDTRWRRYQRRARK